MNAPATVTAPDRQKFLGGSDVAAIFGVSPWRTPLDLYLDKITPRAEQPKIDPEKKKFFARRKRQEPVVAEMLADEYGIVVTRLSLDDNPNRYIDEEHPFLAAEIDFEFLMSPEVREHFPDRPDFAAISDGTLLNGEIKTVHPFKASEWGEEGSEEVPIHYAAQGMHGLGVTRRPAVLIAALFGLDKLVCFPVMRDEETIAAMRKKAIAFWTENVLKRVPPDPVNIDDVTRMYAGMKGRPVNLSDEAHTALVDLGILRSRERQFEIDQAELEWRVARCVAFAWGIEIVPDDKNEPLIASEENAVLMYGGRQVGSWNRQRGSFLDQKRLAAEKPEIVSAYKVEHRFRVMRLKKSTKEKSK
jgi:putative phage-type endonuclease